MKFGVREITDIVFKATSANQKLGGKTYQQYDPILFFDSAKTSTLESSVATVYAQGGRGNPRLLAWDGDKVATFTFEDALISPMSLSALSGGDLSTGALVAIHQTDRVAATDATTVVLPINYGTMTSTGDNKLNTTDYVSVMTIDPVSNEITGYCTVTAVGNPTVANGQTTVSITVATGKITAGDIVLVDYYVHQNSNTIDITPEKFGGYYYIEANTLFRGLDGSDYPAQFIIPKAKIESNFTFTMAPTGDPSTFSFKLDAFPAPVRYNGVNKVLFCLQIASKSSDVI